MIYRYLIYSQGLPLLIVIYVLIVDEVGQAYIRDNQTRPTASVYPMKHLPNMGEFNCFLKNGFLGEGSSYFGHPVFIYFQSFMLVTAIICVFASLRSKKCPDQVQVSRSDYVNSRFRSS